MNPGATLDHLNTKLDSGAAPDVAEALAELLELWRTTTGPSDEHHDQQVPGEHVDRGRVAWVLVRALGAQWEHDHNPDHLRAGITVSKALVLDQPADGGRALNVFLRLMYQLSPSHDTEVAAVNAALTAYARMGIRALPLAAPLLPDGPTADIPSPTGQPSPRPWQWIARSPAGINHEAAIHYCEFFLDELPPRSPAAIGLRLSQLRHLRSMVQATKDDRLAKRTVSALDYLLVDAFTSHPAFMFLDDIMMEALLAAHAGTGESAALRACAIRAAGRAMEEILDESHRLGFDASKLVVNMLNSFQADSSTASDLLPLLRNMALIPGIQASLVRRIRVAQVRIQLLNPQSNDIASLLEVRSLALALLEDADSVEDRQSVLLQLGKTLAQLPLDILEGLGDDEVSLWDELASFPTPDEMSQAVKLSSMLPALTRHVSRGNMNALSLARNALNSAQALSHSMPEYKDFLERLEWDFCISCPAASSKDRLDYLSDALTGPYRRLPDVVWRRLRHVHEANPTIFATHLQEELPDDVQTQAHVLAEASQHRHVVWCRGVLSELCTLLSIDDQLLMIESVIHRLSPTHPWQDELVRRFWDSTGNLIPGSELAVRTSLLLISHFGTELPLSEIALLLVPLDPRNDEQVSEQLLLGNLLKSQGQTGRALACFQRVAKSQFDDIGIRSLAAAEVQRICGDLSAGSSSLSAQWSTVWGVYDQIASSLYWSWAVDQKDDFSLRARQQLPERAAYAALRAGRVLAAIDYIESGQAMMANATLRRTSRNPDLVRIHHPAELGLWERATARLAQTLRSEFPEPDDVSLGIALTFPPTRRLDREDFLRRLARRRPDLSDLLSEERRAKEGLMAVAGPLLPPPDVGTLITHCANTGSQFIYLVTTPWGGAAILVRPDGGINPIDLPNLTEDAVHQWTHLRDQQAPTRGPVRGPDSEPDPDTVEAQLASMAQAMGPLIEHLSDHDPLSPLLVVPAGPLALLPIAAAFQLARGRKSWLDVHIAASARLHITAHDNAAPLMANTLLAAVTDPEQSSSNGSVLPPLPGAHAEGELLHERWDARHWTGASATRDNLNTAASLATKALHLALHGMIDDDDPEHSTLFLAHGRTLNATEISRQRINSRLVYLASCWTGKPASRLPDEALGFPTLLIQSGAPAVIAPLWPINDAAARTVTETFYREWLDRGAAPGAALAVAMQTARRAHPETATWAAFTFYGA